MSTPTKDSPTDQPFTLTGEPPREMLDLARIYVYGNGGPGTISAAWVEDRAKEKLLEREEILKLLRLFLANNRRELAGLYWSLGFWSAEISFSTIRDQAPREIAVRWPQAAWVRETPKSHNSEPKPYRDWVATVQGVVLRIEQAESVKPIIPELPVDGPIDL